MGVSNPIPASRENQPIEPSSPSVRRGKLYAVAFAFLLLYLGYFTICYHVERLSRARFSIPSIADIRGAEQDTQRISIELARHDRIEERGLWLPYLFYQMACLGIAILGAIVAGIFSWYYLWRIAKLAVTIGKIVAIVILFASMGAFLVLSYPPNATARYFENQNTEYHP